MTNMIFVYVVVKTAKAFANDTAGVLRAYGLE